MFDIDPFEIDPKSLTDTRIQLHWATQLLSAAADAKIPKADDDSHSNLGWNEHASRFEGRSGVSFDVLNFAVQYQDGNFPLTGKKLADGASWLSEELDAVMKFRDYEMPQHNVRYGELFQPNHEHLKAIACWFSFGKESLEDYGELRIWPHHFDLGFWNQTENEGKSIGGGFSLGDDHFDQPYFYINPYGIDPDGMDRPETFPKLSHGHWTKHWTGAVLTAVDLANGVPQTIAKNFADEAINRCHELLNQGY